MQITKLELQNLMNRLLGIEIYAVQETLKKSQKENPPDYFKKHAIMAQSYLKGLERASEIISTVLSEIKDDKED